MTKPNLSFKMNKANLNLVKTKSRDIYKTLCSSESLYDKCFKLERDSIAQCLDTTVSVLLKKDLGFVTGSAVEGTQITPGDYSKGLHSWTPCYVSDRDIMNVLCEVQVIDEGETLPLRLDNYMYCQAERGEHTSDGFRKLRVIQLSPECKSISLYKGTHWSDIINLSFHHGYLSSSKSLSGTPSVSEYAPFKHHIMKTGFGTKGPSRIIEGLGDHCSAHDFVNSFYVKTWPKEAESWFTRQTHWPDRKLKSKIKKIGYLLVPTGNSNSQESDLEWRCSFSIAEKILFQSITTFQRCTFVMLKVLLKEYLPSDINRDDEKKLLSTYHMKTLFLWSLEDCKLEWEPENMLDIINHLLDKLSEWINRQYLPHFFIPSINLLDIKRLCGRKNSLIRFISGIRNDLFNKIKQSQFFIGQKIHALDSKFVPDFLDTCFSLIDTHHIVHQCIKGRLQLLMHNEAFFQMHILKELHFSHLVLIEGILGLKHDTDPQVQHLYRALYTEPIHEKLITEVVPGLIDQYRGCIYLAKYRLAARDRRVLPGVLHTAESLLKDTLHLDPCSGYVKLACLYTYSEMGDFMPFGFVAIIVYYLG